MALGLFMNAAIGAATVVAVKRGIRPVQGDRSVGELLVVGLSPMRTSNIGRCT